MKLFRDRKKGGLHWMSGPLFFVHAYIITYINRKNAGKRHFYLIYETWHGFLNPEEARRIKT